MGKKFGRKDRTRSNYQQLILGHANRTTTEIYLHSIEEAEQEAMKVLEKMG
jgi:integrase